MHISLILHIILREYPLKRLTFPLFLTIIIVSILKKIPNYPLVTPLEHKTDILYLGVPCYFYNYKSVG